MLMASAFLLSAAIAHADALRVVAPANGATLRGGSFAELRWSAAKLPAPAEEWEAFLSIDGGTYYAFRVTPHLDIDLHRFTFIVPNVDTRDARILIRTGNEVHETRFESRGSFTIVRDAKAAVVLGGVTEEAQPADGGKSYQADFLEKAKRSIGHLHFDQPHWQILTRGRRGMNSNGPAWEASS